MNYTIIIHNYERLRKTSKRFFSIYWSGYENGV